MKLSKLLLVILFVNSIESSSSLVCLPAKNDGDQIGVTMAAYLDIDGYTNRSVRTCKRGDCDEMDNFKYCKEPLSKFIIKSIGPTGDTFVVSNRCNGGFKKFKRVGMQDPDGTFLFEEKMAYQIKHQVWSSTLFVPQPVLEIREREGFIELIVQDFTEDLWQIEWEREDIDISLFTIKDEDADSYKTICTSEDSFTSLEKLKSMIPKEEEKLLFQDTYLGLESLEDEISIPKPKETLIINETETNNKNAKKENIKFTSTMPTLKKSGKLNFPDKARKSALEGEVSVIFDINEYGQPLNIRIKTSSNKIFNEAALNATNGSKYNPALDEYGNVTYMKNLAVTYEFNL